MVRLHLSREWFHSVEETRPATPICGALDGVATLRRGRGEGLVPPAAWGAEFHCPECYRKMLRDPKAAE